MNGRLLRLAAYVCISIPSLFHSRLQAQALNPDSASWLTNLPEGIHISGEFRTRTEGHTAAGLRAGNDYGQALTRLRLNLDITRLNWLRVFVQAQDSRFLNLGSASSTVKTTDALDIEQAYFEVKAPGLDWIRLQAGRQEVFYGSQRLLSDSGWPNTGGVFDAAKLIIGNADRHLDLLALSPVNVSQYTLNTHVAGEDLFGFYGVWKGIARGSVIEPYFLWKKLGNLGGSRSVPGPADIYTAGSRWQTDLKSGLEFSGEAAEQWGHRADTPVLAWAAYAIGSYSSPQWRWHTRVSSEYGYASGSGPSKDVYGTFDSLYPRAHGPYGFTDLAGWRNIRHLRTGVAAQPLPKLSLQFDVHFLSLASKYDGLYDASRILIVNAPALGAVSTNIGQETDMAGTYAFARNAKLTLGFGHLFPGGFLKEYRPHCASSFPYASFEYRF